ncbi:MAG TPA: histidine kinase [Candidatus Babeliaceae bacterium]|nr:histidine kinase [Candidatus Babeliaceae bacterium]
MSLLNLVTIGIFAMLLLVISIIIFIVYHQKRITVIHLQKEKELTEAAIQAEEEERSRIAAELHDDVGAMLASVRLYLNLAARQPGDTEALQQSRTLIDGTIDKVRSLSRSLQPAMLPHLGLQKTLVSFFNIFNNSGVISIKYDEDELPILKDAVALGIYRIVQELVNNTLKHAHATRIWVRHAIMPGNILQFSFSHNGQGITEERFQEYIYKKDATGLKNIINRLKVLNGSISFDNDGKIYNMMISIIL